MKIIVSIKDIKDIDKYKADAYLVGVSNYCTNLVGFSLDEINSISALCVKKKKKLFIGINKNIHESELEDFSNVLKEIDSIENEGLLFYDLSVLSLKKELKLKSNLVWAQEHMVTNYNTINFYSGKGTKYALVSSELSFDELSDIVKNSKSKLIIPLFGYQSMFVSRRNLVSNYLKSFNLDSNGGIRYMEKENKKYAVEDDFNGTVVYSNYILNGLTEALKLEKRGNYVYLNSFNISSDIFKEIVDIYKSSDLKNAASNERKIDELLNGNTDKGFLYNETIYKVKK